MMAMPVNGGSFSFSRDDERGYITDEQGRFTLKNVPSGKLTIHGRAKDFRDSEYAMMMTVREVSGRDFRVRIAPRRAGDPAQLVANPRRAFEKLAWTPRHSALRAIITTAWHWHATLREQVAAAAPR